MQGKLNSETESNANWTRKLSFNFVFLCNFDILVPTDSTCQSQTGIWVDSFQSFIILDIMFEFKNYKMKVATRIIRNHMDGMMNETSYGDVELIKNVVIQFK